MCCKLTLRMAVDAAKRSVLGAVAALYHRLTFNSFQKETLYHITFAF